MQNAETQFFDFNGTILIWTSLQNDAFTSKRILDHHLNFKLFPPLTRAERSQLEKRLEWLRSQN